MGVVVVGNAGLDLRLEVARLPRDVLVEIEVVALA